MEITQNNIPEFDFDIIIDGENQEENTNSTTDTVVTGDQPAIDDVTTDTQGVEEEQTTEEVAKDYGANAEATAVVFYEDLVERGILSADSAFNGTWESLNTELDAIPQKAVNTIIEEAPELTKQIIRFAFAGDEITKESLTNFMKTYLDEIDETPTQVIETMDEARDFLTAQYKAEGKRASVITSMLNALEDDDALLEEAQAEQAKTQEKTKTSKSEALIAEAENSRIAREAQQAQFVATLSSEIEATGWQKTRQDKIKQTLGGNKLNTVLTEAASSPKALVQLADFATYWNPKTKQFDYTAFIAQNESKAAISLKEKAEQAMLNSPTLNTKSTKVLTTKDGLGINDTPIID